MNFDLSFRDMRIENISILPTRVVDYFLVLGPGKLKAKLPKTITKIEDIPLIVDTLDCYPDKQTYSDTPIPDLVGQMVFPEGLSLSTIEKPPYSFSYVLTDINRTKLYGTTLIFYELIEPEQVNNLLLSSATTAAISTEVKEKIQELIRQNVIYTPKALTVISHYAFYTLFTQFLTQLYHVSLSTSPLPLERYIVNFMQELPLPPQGRVELLFSLPETLLHLSRPPKNLLPMVDFSYQPLFACISVDHILSIFSALCMEQSICIVSSNIALLTPIQDALLSFLYPFVWQGCYVPILPNNLMELLDAPVPLLVGIHDDYFRQTTPEERPRSVLFVHVDTDTLSFGERDDGNGEEVKQLLPLPKSKMMKLKNKLIEFGGCIYQSKQQRGACKIAGYPFPNSEHLQPITSYVTEQGVMMSNHQKLGMISNSELMKKLTKQGIRAANDNTGNSSTIHSSPMNVNNSAGSNNNGGAVPFRHPAASTLIVSSNKRSNSNNNSNGAMDILDVENNYVSSNNNNNSGNFNAREIRDAFFRFFVASFIDYQSFFSNNNTSSSHGNNNDNSSVDHNSVDGGNGGVVKKKKKRSLLAALTSSSRTTAANNNGGLDRSFSTNSDMASEISSVMGGNIGVYFHSAAFANHLQDEFLSKMVYSQMFSNFIHERTESNAENLSAEIKYFDENIIAKKNRSKLTFTKSTTPFLSDEKDYLRETYAVPQPSTVGIPANASYSYSSWPGKLNPALFGTPRKPKALVEVPEVKRLRDDVAISILNQSLKQLIERRQSSISANNSVAGGRGGGGNNNNNNKGNGNNSNNSYDNNNSSNKNKEEEQKMFFEYARTRYHQFLTGLIKFQNLVRTRPLRRQFLRIYRATRVIQRFYHAKRISLMLWRRMVVKYSIMIQRMIRGYVQRQRYLLMRFVIMKLQSYYRQRQERLRYQRIRGKLTKLQARLRGYLTRKHQLAYRQRLLKQRRLQILSLWLLERTSLRYRSVFYLQIDQPTCLHLAFYEEELTRLYLSLGVTKATTTCYIANFSKLRTFEEKFQAVNRLPIFTKILNIQRNSTLSLKEMALQLDQLIQQSFVGPKYQALAMKEQEERQQIYEAMKNIQTKTAGGNESQLFNSMFKLLNIEQRKRRKRKLSHYVWIQWQAPASTAATAAAADGATSDNNSSIEEQAKVSAEIVLSILQQGDGRRPGQQQQQQQQVLNHEWLENKQRERVKKHCLETIHACLLSIQRLKNSGDQKTGNSANNDIKGGKSSGNSNNNKRIKPTATTAAKNQMRKR